MLVAGIDGGQTSTTAVITDGAGTILARGYAGPADELGEDAHSTRLRDALEGALDDAMRAGELPTDARFHAIVAGVSGYEGRIVGVAPRLPTDRFVIMHDAPIAHAGALDGEPGVVVIAGTGSVAFATAADGRSKRTGGWGYLFGDEGSAFWIARAAISNAALHDDCEGIAVLLSFFDLHSIREIVQAFYANEISRTELASVAPVCIEAASNNRACGCITQPPHDAARELARLAVHGVVDPREEVTLAFTGGLVQDAWFKEQLYAAVADAFSSAPIDAGIAYRIVEPKREPAAGAALLASRL